MKNFLVEKVSSRVCLSTVKKRLVFYLKSARSTRRMSLFPSNEEFDRCAATDKRIGQAIHWGNLPANVIYRVKSKEDVETEFGADTLLQLVDRDSKETTVWAPPSVMIALCDSYPKNKIPYIRSLETQRNVFQTVFLQDRQSSKKLVKNGVKKGSKKDVPVANKIFEKGVKRTAVDKLRTANKVRRVEESAMKKGVSPELADMVSTAIEEGSPDGINDLSNLVNERGDKVTAKVVKEANKSILPQRQVLKSKKFRSHKQGFKSGIVKAEEQKIPDQIQNLIDSA